MKKGDIYSTKSYGDLIILSYINTTKIHVRFCETGYETFTRKCQIQQGKVKDRLKPSVCGKGFLGVGKYKRSNSTLAYRAWGDMFTRCYNHKVHERNPRYESCSVDKHWWDFQVFAEWYYRNLLSLNQKASYHLDKDILIKGNNIYSEHNCCLVSQSINKLLCYSQNTKGKSPVGVSYHKVKCKFRAQISVNGKVTHLGQYDSQEEASTAYILAKESQIKRQAVISYENNEMSINICVLNIM